MTLAVNTAGTFRLKGRQILEVGRGTENAHQLAMRSGVSIPTVYRIVNQPEQVRSIFFDVLASIMIDGLGMTPDEALNARFGDIFDYVPKDKEKPARQENRKAPAE